MASTSDSYSTNNPTPGSSTVPGTMSDHSKNNDEISVRLPAHVAEGLLLSGIGVREVPFVEQPLNGPAREPNPMPSPQTTIRRSLGGAAAAPESKRLLEALQKLNEMADVPQLIDPPSSRVSDRHIVDIGKRLMKPHHVTARAKDPRRPEFNRFLQLIREDADATATSPKSNPISETASDGHNDCHYECRECGLLYGGAFDGICPECGTKRAQAYCDTIYDDDEDVSGTHKKLPESAASRSIKTSNLGMPVFQYPPISHPRSPSVQTDFLSRPSWDSEVSYRKALEDDIADGLTNTTTDATYPPLSGVSQNHTFNFDALMQKWTPPETGQFRYQHMLSKAPDEIRSESSPHAPRSLNGNVVGPSNLPNVLNNLHLSNHPDSTHDFDSAIRTRLSGHQKEAIICGGYQVRAKDTNENGLQAHQGDGHELWARRLAELRDHAPGKSNPDRQHCNRDVAADASNIHRKLEKDQGRSPSSYSDRVSDHSHASRKNIEWPRFSYDDDFPPLPNLGRAAASVREVSDDGWGQPFEGVGAQTGGWGMHEGSLDSWGAPVDRHAPTPAPSIWGDHVIGNSRPVFGSVDGPQYNAEMPPTLNYHTPRYDGGNVFHCASCDGGWGPCSAGGKPTHEKAQSSFLKSKNLSVTYWATIETDKDAYTVPIDAKHISGPKKAAVKGMQTAWKWLDEKGLRGVVGLEDVFELSNSLINPQKAEHEGLGWEH